MSGKQPTVLIADDDAEIRHLITLALEMIDIAVIAVPDGIEALQQLKSAPIDILIADYKMPGMSGLVLLKEVKKQFPDITRILITGVLEADLFKEAINIGEIYKLITKPFTVKDIQQTVSDAIDYHTSKDIDKEFIGKLERDVKLFFHSFFNAGHAIIITDRYSRIKYVNRAFSKLYGYNIADVLNQDTLQYIAGMIDAKLLKEIRRAVLNKKIGWWKGEMINRCKNEKEFPVLVTIIPLRDHKNKITNFLIMSYDITAQKTLENKIRKSERKYRRIIQNAAEGIFQADFNGKILMGNPAFRTLFLYESGKEFTKRKSLYDIFANPEDVQNLIETIKDMHWLTNVEYRMKRNNGEEFNASLNLKMVRNKQKQPMYIQAFIRDISAEKKMRELNERMQRLEALGQLSAGLAHEIRNPIASLKLNIQFLQRK